jgi:hypothetical protein
MRGDGQQLRSPFVSSGHPRMAEGGGVDSKPHSGEEGRWKLQWSAGP